MTFVFSKNEYPLPPNGVSSPQPAGHMWLRMAMSAAQHKIINLLKIFFFFFAYQFSLVFVYWMCGPRQLFFLQCGPETPKGRTPLQGAGCGSSSPCLFWLSGRGQRTPGVSQQGRFVWVVIVYGCADRSQPLSRECIPSRVGS